MKKFVAVMAIGCAAVMTLAACGRGDGRTANSVEDLQEIYGYQWTDTSKPILNEKGAQEISFTVYSSKDASAKAYNDMDIMQTLYEQTNVFVDWENVSASVYGEQKTLKLGNHKGIDAIYHAGMEASDIIKYAERKTLLPISDYLQYMPNFSKILNERPDIKKQITNVADGKIYSLPRIEEMGLLQNPNLLFLNKNWAAVAVRANAVTGITEDDLKDGLQLTAEQMEQMLTYFKNNDMNGTDGANDERPLSFVYNNWQGNQCDLYGMFGLNDNIEHRVIKDGQVTYTILDDAFKDATNFLHDWIDKGLIDAVSLEQSQNDFLANGKGVEKYGAFYWWESDTVVDTPDNYIVCKPLKGPKNYNGHDYSNCQTISVSNNPEVSTGELIFFADCPNVEVLLTYFDRYYDPEISAQINYGPIGIAFEEEKDANGKLVAKNPPAGKTTDELRLENAPLGICYLSEYAWENVVNMEPRAQLRLERLTAYATPYVPANVKPVPNLQFTRAELDVLANNQSNIDRYVRSNLMDWLRNGVSDSAWSSFKTQIQSRSVGLTEVKNVYQAAYDRYVAEN